MKQLMAVTIILLCSAKMYSAESKVITTEMMISSIVEMLEIESKDELLKDPHGDKIIRVFSPFLYLEDGFPRGNLESELKWHVDQFIGMEVGIPVVIQASQGKELSNEQLIAVVRVARLINHELSYHIVDEDRNEPKDGINGDNAQQVDAEREPATRAP